MSGFRDMKMIKFLLITRVHEAHRAAGYRYINILIPCYCWLYLWVGKRYYRVSTEVMKTGKAKCAMIITVGGEFVIIISRSARNIYLYKIIRENSEYQMCNVQRFKSFAL